jgi:cell wall-associated NlpC family hydrolase
VEKCRRAAQAGPLQLLRSYIVVVRERYAAVMRTVIAAVVLALAVALGAGVPAGAEPGPRSPDDMLTEYKSLGREAEQATEAIHSTTIELTKQREAVAAATTEATAADQTLADLKKQAEGLQTAVDALVNASYKGARVNRLYAVLVSDSPQSLLDQMSGLEMVSRQTVDDVRKFTLANEKAEAAKKSADATKAKAEAAVATAEKTSADLQAKQSERVFKATEIRAMYEALTGKQLAELAGPKIEFDAAMLPKGTAPEVIAVRAALTRIGDPYVWGATGPDQFDCSGLMVWAYKQAGKTLPRSSQAQLAGGTAVDKNDMRPGDLVIYYPDATHVGMYVGNGYVIHASTFGVPVKVESVDGAGPFNSARRY